MAYADRDSYYADPTFVKVPATGPALQGIREGARGADRHVPRDRRRRPPAIRCRSTRTCANGRSGSPAARRRRHSRRSPDGYDPSLKDTTHIAVIDSAGNVFDSTPSGGWITGGVILGNTGVGLSTRGEQFWLDKARAAQLRPRSRPRYTLTPSIVLRDGQPFLAIGTPGGDNQEQTSSRRFLNILEFQDKWYPNLHTAFEWPRMQTFHFLGSFWPHPIELNRLDVEGGRRRRT